MADDGEKRRPGVKDRLITGGIAAVVAVVFGVVGASWIVVALFAAVAIYQFVVAAVAQGVATGRDEPS